MVAVYSSRTREWEIALCESTDVDVHYEVIRADVDDVDEDVYKEKMHKCVDEGTAYKVVSDGLDVGWLYVAREGSKWSASSIYCSDVVGMVCLMVKLRELYGHMVIDMMPHKDDISKLKSLMRGSSIRRWHEFGDEVTIVNTDFVDKFANVFERLGVHERSS